MFYSNNEYAYYMNQLAVSFGLGQSAKLSVFERTTESTIANTRHIPEELAATGHISLSRNEISRRVGQLFVDRSQVNYVYWTYRDLPAPAPLASSQPLPPTASHCLFHCADES
jgi:hypothetical protein